MEVVEYKLTDLIASEYNPRQLTAGQYAQLKDSLTRFGFVDPVIINTHKDRKNIIIGGHQRVKVWGEMGETVAPCVEVKLTRAKERELNVRLNKNVGEWDWDALSDEFGVGELVEWGFDVGEFGLEASQDKETHVSELSIEKLPEMAWCLIGVPLSKWGNVSEHITAISKIDNVFCEARVGNDDKD